MASLLIIPAGIAGHGRPHKAYISILLVRLASLVVIYRALYSSKNNSNYS